MSHPEQDDPTRNFPVMAAARDRVEPAPRRVRGFVGHRPVFDTTRALYVWEAPYYPQYYVPLDDVEPGLLLDEGREQVRRLGTARPHALDVEEQHRPRAALVYGEDATAGVAGHVRFDWASIDAWYEEDEEIFVHPRNPYVRVDALRSHRHVRVELDGLVLADTAAPVLVFETGLPTRYYVDRADVRFEHLEHSETETRCPYKGTTTDYWSVRTPSGLQTDLAWSYQFPTESLLKVAGLVAFYGERVDVLVDGELRPRPQTHLA